MACVMEEFNKALDFKMQLKLQKQINIDEEKEEEKVDPVSKEFIGRMSRRDLFKRLHSFLVKCLRKIRAYNFDQSLIDQLDLFYKFLFNSEKVLDRDIIQLRYNYANAYQNIKKKAENDPNLVGNDEF